MGLRKLLLLSAALSCCHAGLQWTIEEQWHGGFKGRLTLTADQDMTSWIILLTLSGPIDNLESSWFANTQRVNSTTYRLSNLPSNGDVARGQQLSNVFVVRCSTECRQGHPYTLRLALHPPASTGSGSTGGSGSTSGSSGGSDGSGGSCPIDVAMAITERWYGGFKASFSVTARQAVSSWSLLLDLSGPLDNVESNWVANSERVNSDTYRLTSLGSNGNLGNGETLSNAFVVRCNTECRDGNPYTASLTVEQCGSGGSAGGDGGGSGSSSGGGGDSGSSGGGGTSQTTSAPTGNSGGSKNYTQALELSILFYYAQRSGDLTGTFRPFPWVVSSALGDNPVGGWYDAGDYVKFNLPMAWSVVTQLWSVVKFSAGYQAAGQYHRAKDSARWPLDYLLRCWDNQTQELVVQVGDGHADHAVWDRPQNMAMPRPTFKVTTSQPGSDVAAETAAALALGYIVFKDSVAGFASSLLTAAEQLYAFAKTYRGKYSDSVPNAASFYRSSGDQDELCVAAVWLKRATGNNAYLSDAETLFYSDVTAWAYSWDSSVLACQTLLYEETGKTQYRGKVEDFFRGWTGGSNPPHTPCGLVYRDRWGANRYAANAAFMALVAARDGVGGVEGRSLTQFAVQQINYMLGDNHHSAAPTCFSFLIGYGDNFPTRPHHRAASCPSDVTQPCLSPDDARPNPQQLTGAVVGGPDSSDGYADRRGDYVRNEVAVDYNAGLQGALAGIVQLQAENNMPSTNNKCKCP